MHLEALFSLIFHLSHVDLVSLAEDTVDPTCLNLPINAKAKQLNGRAPYSSEAFM